MTPCIFWHHQPALILMHYAKVFTPGPWLNNLWKTPKQQLAPSQRIWLASQQTWHDDSTKSNNKHDNDDYQSPPCATNHTQWLPDTTCPTQPCPQLYNTSPEPNQLAPIQQSHPDNERGDNDNSASFLQHHHSNNANDDATDQYPDNAKAYDDISTLPSGTDQQTLHCLPTHQSTPDWYPCNWAQSQQSPLSVGPWCIAPVFVPLKT